MTRPKGQKEYLEFNGEYFSKEPKTGYWQNTKTRERMHRYVWKHYYGNIPNGFHVHHIDGDKSNNDISNLALLTPEAHSKLHGVKQTPETLEKKRENCDRIRPLTKAWHSSSEGKEWHKEHYDKTKSALHAKKEFVCKNCGKTFTATDNGKTCFCSNVCKSQWRRKMGLDNVEKTCVICGKKFIANKYDKGVCCSRQCAAELRKRK